jgi:hypothetical protein
MAQTGRHFVQAIWRTLNLAGQLAAFVLTSPLTVPPSSHFIRDIFSGTQKARTARNDYADASDINDTHFSVPRVNHRAESLMMFP